MPQMIIASSLVDGWVVFLTGDGDWSRDIGAGALAEDDDQAEALLATARRAEADNRVIDPYLIRVAVEAGVRRPTEYREYIRAHGPSVPIPS